MKYLLGLVLLVTFLFYKEDSMAQRRHGYEGQQRQRPERLEKFRKMRLIEVLKLNEEESVRFFAKQNNHQEKTHQLMQKRNDILDEMENILQDKGNPADLEKLSDAIMNIDKDIFDERQRFQDELQKFLTQEQFAKFIVFERDFGRQVRDAMEEMRRGKIDNPPGE